MLRSAREIGDSRFYTYILPYFAAHRLDMYYKRNGENTARVCLLIYS